MSGLVLFAILATILVAWSDRHPVDVWSNRTYVRLTNESNDLSPGHPAGSRVKS